MESMKAVLSEELSKAVRAVAPAFGVTDVNGLSVELLVYLGIQERIAGSAAVVSDASSVTSVTASVTTSVAKPKARSRTVSKKMKEAVTAMGGSESQLEELIKVYKSATDEDIERAGGTFELFAREFLGKKEAAETVPAETPAAEAPAVETVEKKEKKKGGKATKAARITWTPTPKKMFKEIVEGTGGQYTDDLKNEFTTYLNDKSDEDFTSVSVEGHMRAFAITKFAPPAPPVLTRHDAVVEEEVVSTAAGAAAGVSDDDDEDLEEVMYDGETLMVGVKSGKVYRSTEEAGDVLIGVIGQGRFKNLKRLM